MLYRFPQDKNTTKSPDNCIISITFFIEFNIFINSFQYSQLQLSYNLRMSVSVCVSVCPNNFGAASRCQNLTDLSEIWYTCSLGKYLGFFFLFFLNFDFRALGPLLPQNEAKTLGQPREAKT